jgi:NDP-sugar pyrophosphorylase family protein
MPNVHVIITMAGHSTRFKAAGYIGPKALLSVGESPMIEHVVNMFNTTNDFFHIVVNEDQIKECPGLVNYLNELAPRLDVIIIPSHDKGPVYSALQIEGIPPNEEVILSYCDFTVEWNYGLFLRSTHGCDGCVVSFRGFHPASFGETYYAYMRVDKNNRMLELREKKPFTDERHNEHASTGIYYFRSWSIFSEYAERWMTKENKILPEVYGSLLYNDMVNDGLDVCIYEVEKFICLGTPEDLEQYLFWYKYYYSDAQITNDVSSCSPSTGLIPMAGTGSRFRKFGYRLAKPLITVNGMPMVIRTVQSLPHQDKWVFLVRQEDLKRHNLETSLRGTIEGACVIGVTGTTSGQAATCMLAEDLLQDGAELLISSCDYEHRFDYQKWQQLVNDPSIDGVIWTYRTRGLPLKNPQAFAYCEVAEDGFQITRIVEKSTISDTPHLDPLVVGTFWYRRAADFKAGANNLINNDIRINGEHYVGTSINHLIDKSLKFVIFDIEQWISFGDPFELQVAEYWDEYFLRLSA